MENSEEIVVNVTIAAPTISVDSTMPIDSEKQENKEE
jgi:hypothetical protein